MRISESGRRSIPSGEQAAEPVHKPHGIVALLLVAVVLVASFVLVLPRVPALLRNGSDLLSQLASSLSGESGTIFTNPLNYTVYSPLIQNGGANISYPSDYSVLSSYALGLVNSDRANYSLGSVILSDSQVAQQHADSMLKYGYFSHNDTQGFKPYMRYSLLGGRGGVEENIGFTSVRFPHYTSTSSVKDALKSLEYSMMYNDSQCCNNGHRYNILSVLHNRVSVGVAYSSTKVYFVEDFENYYIDLNFSVSKSYYVTMTGPSMKPVPTVDAIYITYDHTPSPETPEQLNSGPHEYGPGLLVGGVLPPCDLVCQSFERGISVHADTWVFSPNRVAADFSLDDFIQRYGAGVYNVYLITGADTSSAITSISVFVG
jgi:uncharacterized protein YkwD